MANYDAMLDDCVAALENPPPYIGDRAFAAFLKAHDCQTEPHSFRMCYFGAAICPWREDDNDAPALAERLHLHKPEDLQGDALVSFLQTLIGLFRAVDLASRESPFALSAPGEVRSREDLVALTDRRVDELYLGILDGVWQDDRTLRLTEAEAAMLTAIEQASDRYDRIGFELNRDGGALESEIVSERLRELTALDKEVEDTVNELVASFREDRAAERRDMTRCSELLETLARSEEFPTDAVRECMDRRDEVVPALLYLLEAQTESSALREDMSDALFLGVHILGELREKRTFAPLMDLLAADGDRLDKLFGDAITATFPKILIATFDGDLARLYRLIENDRADEYARTAAFQCWIYYVATERIDRAEAERYLTNAPKTLKAEPYNYVWIAWLEAVAYLGFSNLNSAVRNAYDRGLIDSRNIRFGEFEEIIDTAMTTDDLCGYLAKEGLSPFEDTIGTLSGWYGYSDDYIRAKRERERRSDTGVTDLPLFEPLQPAANPMRNVGRNDPCPCGSGKKYKKCCLR